MKPAEAIEWPVGSGRVALYSDAERRYVAGFFRQVERDEIGEQECVRQVLLLHEVKVELGADLVRDVV